MICLQLEWLHFDIGFEYVGNFGIEEQSNDILLKGKLDIVVIGSMDNHVEVDPDHLDSFIAISQQNNQRLLV